MKLLDVEVKGTCHLLGDFVMDSDVAVVTDPCYDLDTWCQAKIENVLQGTWKGYVYRKPDGLALAYREQDIAKAKEEIESSKEIEKLFEKLQEQKDSGKEFSKEEEVLFKITKSAKEFSFVKDSESRLERLQQSDFSRVSILAVCHESVDLSSNYEWKPVEADIGVDSGQMSIAPLSSWLSKENSLDYEGPTTPNEEYPEIPHRGSTGPYWKVCDLTCSESLGGGIFDNRAAVSRTGYGDGSYVAFTLTHNDKVCGIAVVFMPDWNPEEEESLE